MNAPVLPDDPADKCLLERDGIATDLYARITEAYSGTIPVSKGHYSPEEIQKISPRSPPSPPCAGWSSTAARA